MCLDVASFVTGSAIPKMKHLPPQARGPFSESGFFFVTAQGSSTSLIH